MAAPAIVQKDAGQSQKLTTLLRDLVRRYPKTIGIFNEFLQNADDAEASDVTFILDRRTHTGHRLPAPQMANLLGPALLIHNNSVFSEADFESIQQIGDSGKALELAKTGRFGFGFNSSYNITDYPSFVSREWLYFFDPHRDAMPDGKPGVAYQLTSDLWASYPDLLQPFEAAGLSHGTTDFRGTIFRLPLRTPERASRSEIRDEPFTESEFAALVARFAEVSPGVLIFLKHLLRVFVYDIDAASGAKSSILSVTTSNAAQVETARRGFVERISRGGESVLAELAAEPVRCSYQHELTVTRGSEVVSHRWQIVSGSYFDAGGAILGAARAMAEAKEKAIPWVGVAAYLAPDAKVIQPLTVEGMAYCFLPLPIRTGLPVHINGFFDLGSDRRTLTHDPNSLGRDEVRVRWNALLCQHAIPLAYADLISEMATTQTEATDLAFYSIWPDPGGAAEQPLSSVATNVYRHLDGKPVIRCATTKGEPWAEIGAVWVPPDRPLIQQALVAEGLAVPDPPLPLHVTKGFRAAGIKLDHLGPADLRAQLQCDTDVDTPLDDAPRPALKRREWVEDLLRYCMSEDGAIEKIAGLPLVILCDGRLHTIGKVSWVWSFLAGEAERSIYRTKPHYFVDPEFADAVKLQPSQNGKIATMGPEAFALNLWQLLDPRGGGETVPWVPDGPDLPNAAWLTDVFAYLAQHHAITLPVVQKWKVQPPILPDARNQLSPASFADSPMLVPKELSANQPLRDALDAFGVARIVGPAPLLDAIEQFAGVTNGAFVRFLTGANLAASLKESLPHWKSVNSAYSPDVHDPLLDFLSDERWTARYTGDDIALLRSLPLYPTEDGQVVRLDEGGVYVTPDDPPTTPCKVKLLKLGDRGRWRGLFFKLRVPALDRATLIRDVLLPQYPECDAAQQYELLTWIRDHLRLAVRQTEGSDAQKASALKALVSEALLIHCADGACRPAIAVYDPNQRVIQDILGDDAPVVDLRVYGQEWDEWLSFLQYLGMPPTPRPEDLLASVDRIVELAGSQGVDRVSDRIARLVSHLGEHWELLANATVCDPCSNGNRRLLSEALAERSWLAPEVDAKRTARFAGYKTPAPRLYRPCELYPIRHAHLCASQVPISGYPRTAPKFTRAIGMPTSVPDAIVLNHFEALLGSWTNGDGTRPSLESFQASLGKIYARLGGTKDADEDVEDGEPTQASENTVTTEQLRERFATKECLWDPTQRKLWRPGHVFLTRVPFFEPRRAHLKIADPDQDRGYSALGRHDEPSIDDYVQFLRDVAEEYSDVLPPELLPQVLDVEARLADAILHARQASVVPLTIPDDVPLVTHERRFVASDATCYCDAEWYLDRLEPGRVHVLFHPGTAYSVACALRLPRLSEVITPRLVEAVGSPSDPAVHRACVQWQATLRSPQFSAGLVRLLRCVPSNDMSGVELSWLTRVRIIPVNSIRTELLIDRGAGPTPVGESESDDFVESGQESQEPRIYLSQSAGSRLEMFLTRALVRHLNPLLIDRPLELQQILGSDPEAIDSLLTRLKVPQFTERSVEGDDGTTSDDPGVTIPDVEEAADVAPADRDGAQQPSTPPGDNAVGTDTNRAEGGTNEQSRESTDEQGGPGDAVSSPDDDGQAAGESGAKEDTQDDAEPGEDDTDHAAPSQATPHGETGRDRHTETPPQAPPTGESVPAQRDKDTSSEGRGGLGAQHQPRELKPHGPPTKDTHGKPATPSKPPSRHHRGRALTYVTAHELAVATPDETRIEEAFKDVPFGVPDELIVEDAKRNTWCVQYGFDRFSKLFTGRQSMALGTFVSSTRLARQAVNSNA